MKRCPGEAEGVRCAHGAITQPLSIVWAAIEVALDKKATLLDWERGGAEPWARAVLLLPGGYRWAGHQILWHVGTESRPVEPWGVVYPVVVSRAIEPDGAEVT
jgi:hypothetical protein